MAATRFPFKLTLSLWACALISSCAMQGLTDGYSRLSDAQKREVVYSSLSHDKIAKILMLNGLELKERLGQKDINVVYYYNPNCVGDACVPLSSVRNAVGDKGKLYIVAASLEPRVLREAETYAIYGIDKYFYKSRYLFRYEYRFFDDLTDRTTSKDDTSSLYVFRGRQFVTTTSISALPSLLDEL